MKNNIKKLFTRHENNLNKYRLVTIANITINKISITENGFIIRTIILHKLGNLR